MNGMHCSELYCTTCHEEHCKPALPGAHLEDAKVYKLSMGHNELNQKRRYNSSGAAVAKVCSGFLSIAHKRNKTFILVLSPGII